MKATLSNQFTVRVGARVIDYIKWEGPLVTATQARAHYIAGTAPDGAVNPRCLLGADGLTATEREKLTLSMP